MKVTNYEIPSLNVAGDVQSYLLMKYSKRKGAITLSKNV